MHFKTAYLKLTGFYVLIVMVISVVFSVVIYNISSNELESGLGRQARIIENLPPGTQLPSQIRNFEKIRDDQISQSEGDIELDLLYFNILILILSATISYFLAKKTLSPIEEAMETQNRFTADASHELRTPLTAMKTEIEVALRDKKITLEESKKMLVSNLEEVGKLESLTAALLKLAQNNHDNKADFESLSLEEIITDGFQKVEKMAKKKSIIFENDLKEINVVGEKRSLTELFVILLDNAIKYSHTDSKISISMEKEKNYAVVRIKDCGIGIKSSDLPYIFNRFYRADSSRSKDKISGYGLGLSIAKKIVEKHHGEISVNSTPGHGSEFSVKLPIEITK